MEGYSLYYSFTQTSAVTKVTNQRNAFVRDHRDSGQALTDKEAAYVNDTDAYIKTTKQRIQYAQIGFVGLWGIGVAQALIEERHAPLPNEKKKKRKYGPFGMTAPDEVDVGPGPIDEAAPFIGERWALNLTWSF